MNSARTACVISARVSDTFRSSIRHVRFEVATRRTADPREKRVCGARGSCSRTAQEARIDARYHVHPGSSNNRRGKGEFALETREAFDPACYFARVDHVFLVKESPSDTIILRINIFMSRDFPLFKFYMNIRD